MVSFPKENKKCVCVFLFHSNAVWRSSFSKRRACWHNVGGQGKLGCDGDGSRCRRDGQSPAPVSGIYLPSRATLCCCTARDRQGFVLLLAVFFFFCPLVPCYVVVCGVRPPISYSFPRSQATWCVSVVACAPCGCHLSLYVVRPCTAALFMCFCLSWPRAPPHPPPIYIPGDRRAPFFCFLCCQFHFFYATSCHKRPFTSKIRPPLEDLIMTSGLYQHPNDRCTIDLSGRVITWASRFRAHRSSA